MGLNPKKKSFNLVEVLFFSLVVQLCQSCLKRFCGIISLPLTTELVQKGHSVKVISSNLSKQKDIEALGAKAAIGNLTDTNFLIEAFADADAVYCMTPFNFMETDQEGYFQKINNNYVQAITKARIKKVVILSGWAADVIGATHILGILNQLSDISVVELRPTGGPPGNSGIIY